MAFSDKLKLIIQELKAHLPFTLLGVLASLVVLTFAQVIFANIFKFEKLHVFENFFHGSHYSHIVLSAMASAAILFRHSRQVLRTAAIAIFATLLFCAVSDILIPFFGGKLLGAPMHFHLDILESPVWVLLFALVGVWTGILCEIKLGKISYFSHGSHVFVSSLASLFYLVSYGVEHWVPAILWIFVVTTLAVVIPCCSSDIILPLSFTGGLHGHEHEDEHTQKH